MITIYNIIQYSLCGSSWLYNIARGIDLEAVTPRMTSKSIGCCKKFPGRNAITGFSTLDHWLHELAKEICERLEQDALENNRRPKQLVVSYMQTINNNDVSSSRSLNLTTIDEDKIVNDAIDVLKRNTDKFLKSADNDQILNNPIKFLGLSVGKFEVQDSKRSNTIQGMFKKTIDIQAKVDEQKENESMVSDGPKMEEHIDDELEKIAPKKCATIQEMFKKTAESTVTEDDKKEEPSTDDTGNDSLNQEVAKRPNVGQSFFAKFRISKPAPATEEVGNQPSTSAEPTTVDSNDDLNSFQNEELLEEMAENEQILSRMRAPSPVAGTSKAADYTQTYAEFYRPPSNLEVPKVQCSQCNKMVNAHEMQVHTDEHFAFQLTQEQRVEYQSQMKTSTTATETPPAAKKLKKSKSSTTLSTAFSIDKFLVKKDAPQHNEESIAGCSNAINVETEACSECGKSIPIADILEHMDYHAAKKLHEELLRSEMALNRTAVSDTKTKGSATSSGKGSKNKKKTNNSNSNNNNSMKSIATFFQNT